MAEPSVLILKGNLIFTPDARSFKVCRDSYLIAAGGMIRGVCRSLPEQYQDLQIHDYTDRLIIPGFVDLHTHGAQFNQRGLGLDYTLLDWLEKYTFPEEGRFSDPDYASQVYEAFAADLIVQGTTRAAIYATVHPAASRLLFEILSRRGVGAYVGKVNMDANCPAFLREDTAESLRATEEILAAWSGHSLVKPVITPRFAPTGSRELLEGLGKLALKYHAPVQSHLAENTGEIKWVKELFPEHREYHQVYQHYSLFGRTPTLMAHCIHLSGNAIQTMKENQVTAVHCPDSNMNLSSGIMPVRKLLNAGVKVGLGSDVGAGHSLSMPQTMVRAIQLSKIKQMLEPEWQPLTLPEAFYLATKGGGSFFGRVGSFEPGYELDALVIDVKGAGRELDPLEKLQQFIYAGTAADIRERYAAGRRIQGPA